MYHESSRAMNYPELALRREGAFRSLSEGEIARQQSVRSEAEMCTEGVSIPPPAEAALSTSTCLYVAGRPQGQLASQVYT